MNKSSFKKVSPFDLDDDVSVFRKYSSCLCSLEPTVYRL